MARALTSPAERYAGGSPGERGTVTQWAKRISDPEERKRAIEDAMQRRTVTQETSAPRWTYRERDGEAHLLIDRGVDRGVIVGSIFHPHNVEYIATVLEDAEHLDKPFPNAYPGPQMDGQPTWTCDFGDVIVGDYQVAERLGGPWLDPHDADYDYADVVRVRRIPQPQPATAVEVLVDLIQSFPPTVKSDEATALSILDALFDGGYRVVPADVLVENEDTGT